MASIFSHPAVPISTAMAAGSRAIPPKLLLLAIAGSVIPDVDVVGFSFGVPYGSLFGHRGFTHSICFAVMLGLVGAGLGPRLGASRAWGFAAVFLGTVSHGVLDALTDGGLGIAFFSPFSNERYSSPGPSFRSRRSEPADSGPGARRSSHGRRW